MSLQICDAWGMHRHEVIIDAENEKKKEVKLSKNLFRELSVHTIFVLSNKNPKILGLINATTGELCLGYETKQGFYDKMPMPETERIEQKVMECFV